MIKNDVSQYFSQSDRLFGIYKGVIEDNNDPEKMGRCRIRIFGVHTEKNKVVGYEGIPTNELPWSEPALSLFEGSVSGFGAWTIPLQGSLVFLFFEQGHILKPIYFASVPGKPTSQSHGFKEGEGFSDPDGNFPVKSRLNEPDFHRLARNEGIGGTIVASKKSKSDINIDIAQGGTWDEPSFYNAKYPHNKVFSTHSGITIELDDTEGSERLHIFHPSNSYIEIDVGGNMIIKNSSNKFEIVNDDKNMYIKNNLNENIANNKTNKIGVDEIVEIGNDQNKIIGNNKTIKVEVDETQEVGNNQSKTIGNNKTVNTGSNVNETAGGTHTIIASTIHLNP